MFIIALSCSALFAIKQPGLLCIVLTRHSQKSQTGNSVSSKECLHAAQMVSFIFQAVPWAS